MLACIVGALLCNVTANIQIDGPIDYAQPSRISYAWSYAAYYQPPLLSPQVIVLQGRGRS